MRDPEEFPFTTPAESETRMFIQWKGTDVCIDFQCTCGQHSHFDGYFAYALKCPSCGAIWEMGTQVIAKRNDKFDGCVQLLDDHEDEL